MEKGWGVWVDGKWASEQKKPGANFAGHYIVIVWGCGSGCLRMAVSDAETGAETGAVYDPPISDGEMAPPMLVFANSGGRAAEIEYRRDSRLMLVRATPHPERQGTASYAFYFLWQDNRWILLRRIAIEQ